MWPRAAELPAALDARVRPQQQRRVHRRRLFIHGHLELCTRHRDHALVVALQFGSDQRELECRVTVAVSDEGIREPEEDDLRNARRLFATDTPLD